MQQIPQDTAQQILASREAYKTATSTLSKPTSFNIGQLTTQAMSGGIGSAVLGQQQRTATELQRQQALQEVQSEYKQFEIGAQEAAAAMASSSKEDADWVLAQKLIDRNKEYAASGDPSVVSKIKYLKERGARGLAKATATGLIREGFTPEGVTATLKSTMYKGKSLAEAVGLKTEPVTISTSPSYVSENAYETMLQKVATGQKASKTLLALGSAARERPKEEIESLMKTSREGREFEKLIATKKITPFIADTTITIPEKKVTMESSPFQVKDITGTILGGGTAGGRAGGAGEFLILDNEYNKLISRGSGSFTAAVDVGDGQMQDYKIVYKKGKIESYSPIGSAQEIKDVTPKVKLGDGSFGGAGARISDIKFVKKIDIAKDLLYPSKFVTSALSRIFYVPRTELVTTTTVGEEFWRKETLGKSLKSIPESIFTKSITAQREADIIKENIKGYNEVAEQLNKVNEQIQTLNKKSEDLTKYINTESYRLKKIEQQYKLGKIDYNTYKSNFDSYNKNYKDYLSKVDSLVKQATEYKTQADSLTSNPSYKTITKLIEERGPLTSIRSEIEKSNMPEWMKYTEAATSSAIEFGGFFSTPIRILRGTELVTGGSYDISQKRYLEGGLQVAGGGLALFGPSLFKTATKTQAGQKAVKWLAQLVFKSGIGLTKGTAFVSAPLITGVSTAKGLEEYSATGSLSMGLGAASGSLFALTAFPALQKQFTVEVRSVKTKVPEMTYGKELVRPKMAVEKGSILTERIVYNEAGKSLTREFREPLTFTSAFEKTQIGIPKPAYVKGQLTVQNLLKKIGIPYTPKPLYIGSLEGGTVTAGFGKGKDILITAEQAQKQYNIVLKALRNQGLTLIEAKEVLKYVPPKDLLYIGEASGIRKISITQKGLQPITSEGGIKSISKLGRPMIKDETLITQGKLTSYPLTTQASFTDPFTGKQVRITSGKIVLPALSAQELSEPGRIALGFKARTAFFPQYAKIEKTFVSDIPYLKAPLTFKGGTSEYLLKTKGERLDLTKAAERKEIIQKAFAPEKYEGSSREVGIRRGEIFAGEEKILQKTKEITRIYDPNNPNKLIATRIRNLNTDGSIKTEPIKFEPGIDKFTKRTIKENTFDTWTKREIDLQSGQYTIRQEPFAVPKELRGKPITAQYLPKEQQLSPEGLKATQEGRKFIIGKEDITQYESQPSQILKKEVVVIPKDTRLIITNTKTGAEVILKPKLILGKGTPYYLKSYEDAEALILDPQYGVQINTGSRVPGKVYNIFEVAKSESVMAKMTLKDVLKTEGKINLEYTVGGKIQRYNVKLNPKTGEVALFKRGSPAAPEKIIQEGNFGVKVTDERITKPFEWLLKDKGGTLGRYPEIVKPSKELIVAAPTISEGEEKIIDITFAGKEPKFPSSYIRREIEAVKGLSSSPPTPSFIPDTEIFTIGTPTIGTSPTIIPVPEIKLYPRLEPSAVPLISPTPTITKVPEIELMIQPTIPVPVPTPSLEPSLEPISSPIPTLAPIISPIITPIVTPVITPIITPVPTPTPTPVPVTIPYITPRPLIAGRIIPIVIPKKEQKKKKVVKKKGKGFEVEIRRKGKFKEAAPFAFKTKEEAVSFGAKKTLQEAAATFRIKPSVKPIRETSATPVPVSKYFRPPKKPAIDTYVQKKTLRITSPGEKREISFKGAMAKRAKGSTNFLNSKTKSKKGRFF